MIKIMVICEHLDHACAGPLLVTCLPTFALAIVFFDKQK